MFVQYFKYFTIILRGGVFRGHTVVMECDLQPQSQLNILIKYANDTNLLVPEHRLSVR